jgi:hypothetical protein
MVLAVPPPWGLAAGSFVLAKSASETASQAGTHQDLTCVDPFGETRKTLESHLFFAGVRDVERIVIGKHIVAGCMILSPETQSDGAGPDSQVMQRDVR